MISSTLLGCSTSRNKGACDNRTNMRRDRLEARVLAALREKLLDPALFKLFCDEFTREMNSLRMEAGATIEASRSRRSGGSIRSWIPYWASSSGAARPRRSTRRWFSSRRTCDLQVMSLIARPPDTDKLLSASGGVSAIWASASGLAASYLR